MKEAAFHEHLLLIASSRLAVLTTQRLHEPNAFPPQPACYPHASHILYIWNV